MFFTNTGQVYWLKVHEIPQGGRASRGKPVVNCIAIKPDEHVAATVAVREFSAEQYLIFATRNGTVKKTSLAEYGNVRSTGIRAINIDDGRRADRRAALRRHERHRAGHRRRHEHPLPPGRRARDGPGRHRGEGHRARDGRPGHRHGGDPPGRDAAGGEREGLRQALRAVRLPGAEAGRQGHHHPQADRQDRARSSPSRKCSPTTS